MQFADLLKKVIDGQSLSVSEMRVCMSTIMEGEASDVQIASFLVGLRMKGESVSEITAAAQIMREKVSPVKVSGEFLIDTCGTGGDASGTFNISTAAAFLAASAGARVAKHGNRSVSSKCGSADVLASLGANIDLSAEEVGRVLDTASIAFLFAPLLHPAMRYVMPVRKELGVRTIFNVLGPLTNPAGAKRQLLGVFSEELIEPITETLLNLGTERAFVVHSKDGLDEVSISAETLVGEIREGKTFYHSVRPEDYGIKRVELNALKGGSPEDNRDILMSIFSGVPSAKKDIAVLNAAFALAASGISDDIEDAIVLIEKAIKEGRAKETLEKFITATKTV